MKKIGILMAVFMGIIMSFSLSLVGTLLSGHFEIPAWLISFGISLVISLAIGFIVPMKKIGDAVCAKCKVAPNSMEGNKISGLISDLIYTPLITVVMVVVMVTNARKHIPAEVLELGQGPSVGKELLISLPVCFIVGYILILIFQPLLLKTLVRKYAGQRPN